jgi:hypothetical protein
MIDQGTKEYIRDQMASLEKSMSVGFKHLEKLMTQVVGVNDKEHERMARQIGELYEENKQDRASVDIRINHITEEFDAKAERLGERVTNLEQRQSADEGGTKAKEMSQGTLIAVLFGGLGAIMAIFEIIIPLFAG